MSATCLTMSPIMAAMDVFIFREVWHLAAFQFFHQGIVNPNGFLGYIQPGLMIAAFLIMVVLHVRLELDNRRQNHDHSVIDNADTSSYKVCFLRFAAALAITVAMIGLTQVASVTQLINFKTATLLFMILSMGLTPVLFVLNHDSMRKAALLKIKHLLKCQ